jgi:hypothetical protein
MAAGTGSAACIQSGPKPCAGRCEGCKPAALPEQAAPEAVPEFLPELAEVAGLEHYERCCALQETVWRQLPAIAAGLGKRVRSVSTSPVPISWSLCRCSSACLSPTPCTGLRMLHTQEQRCYRPV